MSILDSLESRHLHSAHLVNGLQHLHITHHLHQSPVTKLLERVVQNRLQSFLDSSDLMPRSQSAYRQFHSTETAVTKVYNDMLLAADGGQVTAVSTRLDGGI